MIAWTWSNDFHLREKIDEILESLELKGFGETDEKIILQCLSGIIQKTTKTKDILALGPDDVKVNIDILRDSLEKTVDFLSSQLNVVSGDFLPQSHQIIPFAYFFSKVNTPSAMQSKLLKQWFWRTSFSLRYSGATDIRLNQDLVFFDKLIEGVATGLEDYSYVLTEKALVNTAFTKANVYTRSFILLLSQNAPLDLTNGNRIDIGKTLSKYNLKEYHHIFPKAFLKERGIPNDKINSICNFCFLPSASNKRIAKSAPSNYILNMVPEDQYKDVLSSNLMPLNRTIYSSDDYDTFLNSRAQIILQYLDSHIS